MAFSRRDAGKRLDGNLLNRVRRDNVKDGVKGVSSGNYVWSPSLICGSCASVGTTYTSVIAETPVGTTAGTLAIGSVGTISGTAAVGAYTLAGTCAMALGTPGTSTLVGHALGTAREVYFCGTYGTCVLPTGVTAFTHYYVTTRGYTDDVFTIGTSNTGTAGTQLNFSGVAGTHMLWTKNP